MRYSFLILKLFIGLLLGLYGTGIYLENSDRFKSLVLTQLKKMTKVNMEGIFDGEVKKVSLLPPSIEIHNAVLSPEGHDDWIFRVDKMVFGSSLLPLLYSKKLQIGIEFQDMKLYSKMDNGALSVTPVFNNLFAQGVDELPFSVKSLSLIRTTFLAEDIARQQLLSLRYNGQLGRTSDALKASIYLLDGSLSVGSTSLFTGLMGNVKLEQKDSGVRNTHLGVSVDCRITFPFLKSDTHECVIEGSWKDGKGAFIGYNEDFSFHIDPIRFVSTKKGILYDGTIVFPFVAVGHFVPLLSSFDPHGKLILSFSGGADQGVSGLLRGLNIRCEGRGIDECRVSFLNRSGATWGTINFLQDAERITGIWEADLNSYAVTASFINPTPWQLLKDGYWFVKPYKGNVFVEFNRKDLLRTEYDITCQHQSTESVSVSKGLATVSHQGDAEIEGNFDTKKYYGRLSLFPHLLPKLVWVKKGDTKGLRIQETRKGITASLSYDFVRSVVHELFDITIPGQGTLEFNGTIDGRGCEGDIKLKEGTIRIPDVYNFISDFSTHIAISWFPFSVRIKDMILEMHKGVISSKVAALECDEQFTPNVVSFPFAIDHGFFNWKNNLFAVLSANGKLEKKAGEPYGLEGSITIEKSQLKENPFSAQEQRKMARFVSPQSLFENAGITFDVTVKTEQPTFVKTPQLEARSTVALHLGNSLEEPELSGTVTLEDGKIFFPYRSLHISRAVMHFLPDQPYNPLLDIVAQETVKKYHIKLFISGSLQNPLISFHSTPHLTEEQIATLLFTGSIEESLNLVVPAFIMQNVETLIFGASPKDSHFSSLFNTLRRMRIVPHFSDESGRGGVRWAIEIEVSDYLHAMIEKNFTLSEDTRFEVDYLFSDDVSFKFTRDQRNDLGAEVEMRFSF